MMKLRITPLRALVAAALGCAALLAWADEQAFTNRATELRERALPDAKVLAPLAENTSVKVLARSGQWTQVEAGGQTGWVRVFHLRFPASVSTSSSGTSSFLAGATSMLGMGKPASQQAANANIGVRGLTPDDLKNANPDPEAVKKMQSYRIDKPGAEGFAREAKLATNKVDYADGGVR